MVTNPDLAALSEAAIYSAHAARKYNAALQSLHRSGDLVLIDREGMREVIFQAAADYIAEMDPATRVDALTVKQGYGFADAAIAAILGEGKS